MSARWPWLTAALVAVAVGVQLVPGASEALALDRAAVGQDWRWWTGHLSHFSWDHLGWDVAVFGVLGGWLESRDRRALSGILMASGLVISWAVLALAPGLETYRGLSGLDAALFAAVAVELWRSSTGRERWLPGGLAAALAAKVMYELATGHTLFADDTGWVPVPLAHAVGGMSGGLTWAWLRWGHGDRAALPGRHPGGDVPGPGRACPARADR